MIELAGITVLSCLLVGAYRWFALRYRWLDHPNQRSSHIVVTPRGAGAVFASLIAIGAIFLLRDQHAQLLSLLIGFAVALTGWWDDIRGTASLTRFIVYTATAAIAVAIVLTMSTDPSLVNFASVLIFAVPATLGLAWLINLYNFMDGINGVAALEAIFVLLGIALLAHNTPYEQIFSPLHFFSCAALIGFLFWNFPAGKVFMGDAGSAFLGFFLGVLMLWSIKLQGPALTVWVILLAIFIADTSYTLFMRIATGQNFFAAHRLHAYQRLTILLKGSHTRATGLLMLVNLCWLLPMAWLVHTDVLGQPTGLILAYAPLLIACRWLKAGNPGQGKV